MDVLDEAIVATEEAHYARVVPRFATCARNQPRSAIFRNH